MAIQSNLLQPKVFMLYINKSLYSPKAGNTAASTAIITGPHHLKTNRRLQSLNSVLFGIKQHQY